ncbi:MAG: bifunctional DNA-formamidopyrimidine glycosylase/DNA-(apurinic or apyrimidinic site) lyase [Acidobacteriota bacterium]
MLGYNRCMPELPEVETIRRGLETHLTGRRILRVRVRETRLRRPLNPRKLRALVTGRRVRGIRRRAKYLILDLEPADHLLVHLGMTGQLFIGHPGRPPVPHEHVVFDLDDENTLRFADTRRFGLLEPVLDGDLERHPLLRGLGPEPLGNGLDPAVMREKTRRLRKPIKNFLLDSRAIAGVGNIYSCEALFRARIHPALQLRRMDEQRWRVLISELRRVLRQAVKRGGTTLQDFVNAEGEAGYFQMQLRVYDRQGEPCTVCATPIRCVVQAGRSTYFCPHCQTRRPRSAVFTKRGTPGNRARPLRASGTAARLRHLRTMGVRDSR